MSERLERRAKSVFHPVRLRILLALKTLGTGTTKEIGAQCPDVPPATLYRHIAALHKDGILEVVRENQINGIIEKVYHLAVDPIDELERSGSGEWMNLLCQFTFTAIADFQKYLARPDSNPTQEAGFRYTLLNLTEEEFLSFARELNECVQKYTAIPPSPKRKTWRFSTITVPVDMNE